MTSLATAILAPALAATGLFGGASDRGAEPPHPARPHVVLLVLDELPGDSMLDRPGHIDAGRFPGFARLAASSTWFRNAFSSYDSTTRAVPLILDGRRPVPGSDADRRWHPRSLFTALGRGGWRIMAREDAGALCPPRLCPGAPVRRPAILPRLNRGRVQRFGAWVHSIRPSRRPTFWMHHALLPHGPYQYLPSGARTRAGARDPFVGMNGEPSFHDPWLTRHNEQRYLLQLGFVDRLIGRLIDRLQTTGLWERSLVVVTADHGYAWQSGVTTRRSVNHRNVHELTPVPLFVKRPAQRRPRVSRAYGQTLDVAPTVARLLGVPLGYRADGRSLFSPAVRRRRGVAVVRRDFSGFVRISGPRYEARRRAVVKRRARQLGSGDWHNLYGGFGPHRELVGRVVGDLARAAGRGPRIALIGASRFRHVRLRGVVPAQVAGTVLDTERGLVVAVAVNGRVEGVGRSFRLFGNSRERFAVNVPEAALRDGRNAIDLYEVTRAGSLRPMPPR